MSERMIELQRARLLAAGKGGAAPPPAELVTHTAGPLAPGPTGDAAASTAMEPTAAQDPPRPVVAHARSEDELLQCFLQRLQDRDDSRAESASAPTVPTALSRRILQRQGVGYLDPTVGAVVSAAADRFLATVLQQSLVCRDQRLKGAEQAREAAKKRKRHLEHYQADRDDRERRKAEKEHRRERRNLAAIEAAETLTKEKAKSTSGGDAGQAKDTDGKSKKKKKTPVVAINGNKNKGDEEEDDENGYDSLDEEEEYYQNYYGSDIPDVDDEDDEDDDMLVLRDIVQPLEAWDFRFPGKEGLILKQAEDEEDEADAMEEDNFDAVEESPRPAEVTKSSADDTDTKESQT